MSLDEDITRSNTAIFALIIQNEKLARCGCVGCHANGPTVAELQRTLRPELKEIYDATHWYDVIASVDNILFGQVVLLCNVLDEDTYHPTCPIIFLFPIWGVCACYAQHSREKRLTELFSEENTRLAPQGVSWVGSYKTGFALQWDPYVRKKYESANPSARKLTQEPVLKHLVPLPGQIPHPIIGGTPWKITPASPGAVGAASKPAPARQTMPSNRVAPAPAPVVSPASSAVQPQSPATPNYNIPPQPQPMYNQPPHQNHSQPRPQQQQPLWQPQQPQPVYQQFPQPPSQLQHQGPPPQQYQFQHSPMQQHQHFSFAPQHQPLHR